MPTFKKRIARIVEALTGCEMERYGERTFALIDKRNRMDAPFSYRAQIRAAIERSQIDLVIDAGANVGQFARELRSFYRGDILSFEPVTRTFEKLSVAAAADPTWHVYQFALGSADATQEINIPESSVFSSLLNTNEYCGEHFGERTQTRRREQITVRRLDGVLAELVPDLARKRIFLKMDTQGYDLEVFKGLGAGLRRVLGLQSEVSLISIYEGMPHWTESISTYERAGFGVVGMFPVTRDAARVIEYDCLLERVPS